MKMSSAELPETRRKPRLSSKGRTLAKVALIFIVPGLVGAFWLMFNIPRQLLRREALRRDGRESMGKITKFGKFGRSSEWWVDYVFVVDGQSIRNEVTVPPSFVDALRHADSLRIRYLPSDPGNNHPAEWEWTLITELGWLLPLAWMVPGLQMVDILRQDRKLAIEGIRVSGTVTSCYSANNTVTVAYDFHGPDGDLRKGKGWSPCVKEAGTLIYVLFLPQTPSRSSPYPMEYYQLAEEG
jgi:hypothetical protein